MTMLVQARPGWEHWAAAFNDTARRLMDWVRGGWGRGSLCVRANDKQALCATQPCWVPDCMHLHWRFRSVAHTWRPANPQPYTHAPAPRSRAFPRCRSPPAPSTTCSCSRTASSWPCTPRGRRTWWTWTRPGTCWRVGWGKGGGWGGNTGQGTSLHPGVGRGRRLSRTCDGTAAPAACGAPPYLLHLAPNRFSAAAGLTGRRPAAAPHLLLAPPSNFCAPRPSAARILSVLQS